RRHTRSKRDWSSDVCSSDLTLLIQNGTLLDPTRNIERAADLLIHDGKITAIGKNLGKADEVLDGAGCYVTPGLIDIHVHLREPEIGRASCRERGANTGARVQ